MNNEQSHILITKGWHTGEKINLSNLSMTIGRDAASDFQMDVDVVSRQHARITFTAGGYVIEDLGSRNGTFVNEQRIQTAHILKNGDLIALGTDVEMRVVFPVPEKIEGERTISIQDDMNNVTMSLIPPDASDQTIVSQQIPLPEAIPPRLVINESGKDPKFITLTADRVKIGRYEDNDVVLDNRFVSRHHAELEKRGQDYYLIPSSNFSNSLLLDGQPVMAPTRLSNGAKIRLGGYAPGEMVSLDYLSPAVEGQQVIKFAEKKLMSIGRDPSNAIVLPAPAVSRFHAEVEQVGQRFRVRDLHSSNGTFVNGKPVTGETWVHPGDAIQIGPYRFVVAEGQFSGSDQSEGVSVDIYNLNKQVSKSLNILQDISLAFKPKEFVVVVGQSGSGKSTLVDAIAGYRPATHGDVIVNKTINVYKEFDAIRSNIGYVPQKDIIHMELTVFQALNYAAQLRMPADTPVAERVKRIEEVMDDLDLSHRRDTQISKLSGGQQKRVSIGVELLTKPGLFFLDEPTSGLDPGMETELMRLMRRLADQGRTIVMITHATKNVMLADKVVFMGRGGYLAWFGPPEEALAYFDQYRTERDRRAGPMEFDHIYTLLDQAELGTPAEWAERFRKHSAYGKYNSEPSGEDTRPQITATAATVSKPLARRNQVSALRQFLILSARNIKILTVDKFGLALLLLTAPLLASLDFVLASGVGRNPLSFKDGDFYSVIITLIVLTNTAILVGALAFMRELVKEREIYKRERMVNLKLSSYIMSKIWVCLVLAFYQAICYTLIHFLAFENTAGTSGIVLFYITMYLLTVAGMMIGLFASALAPNANTAPLLLILFIIPQMVLSGALVSLPIFAEAPASSHWAFQAFMGIEGAGSDVAHDACWALPASQRDNLTLDYKNSNCTCMGENALRQSSCNFPALGSFYTAAFDTQDPIKPTEPGPQPAEPTPPEPPAAPADPNNLPELQGYVSALNTYNEQAAKSQSDYKDQINAWRNQQDQYKTNLETYQKDLTDLMEKRAIAVGSAESTIKGFKKTYGWTFLDKKNPSTYLPTIAKTWLAQLAIILIVFVGTVIVQKRREVS